MSDDDRRAEVRRLLERIATSAGDPPSDSLALLTDRRHRRLRRRRGAVATAAVLAVLLAATELVRSPGEQADVSASRVDEAGPGEEVQLPDSVDLRCGPDGIDVPVASVRPRRDGLHVRVENRHRRATTVWVEADGWSSGPVEVDAGVSTLRQPVPPGVLSVGCEVRGSRQQRRVDLVDVDGVYSPPALDCDEDEVRVEEGVPLAPDGRSMATAARAALDEVGVEGGVVGAVRGYVGQKLGDPTEDPIAQVSRDGEALAFVHLHGDGGTAAAPWTSADLEACEALFAADDTADDTSDEDVDAGTGDEAGDTGDDAEGTAGDEAAGAGKARES